MNNITPDSRKFNPSEHLIDLKGKKYLQVAWRIMWLRDVHPDWCIHTEAVEISKDIAIFHALILNENSVEIASAHGSETPRDFGDYIEKAETKAVGRALAYAGMGTQFTADELDEGERIVDSPVAKKETEDIYFRCEDCGAVIKGGKYQGKEYGARDWTELTKKMVKKQLCPSCMRKANG